MNYQKFWTLSIILELFDILAESRVVEKWMHWVAYIGQREREWCICSKLVYYKKTTLSWKIQTKVMQRDGEEIFWGRTRKEDDDNEQDRVKTWDVFHRKLFCKKVYKITFLFHEVESRDNRQPLCHHFISHAPTFITIIF